MWPTEQVTVGRKLALWGKSETASLGGGCGQARGVRGHAEDELLWCQHTWEDRFLGFLAWKGGALGLHYRGLLWVKGECWLCVGRAMSRTEGAWDSALGSLQLVCEPHGKVQTSLWVWQTGIRKLSCSQLWFGISYDLCKRPAKVSDTSQITMCSSETKINWGKNLRKYDAGGRRGGGYLHFYHNLSKNSIVVSFLL